MALAEMHCEACHKGAEPVSDIEARKYLCELPDWKIVEEEGEKRLRRSYEFDDFAQALEFTDRVGGLAEEVDHHPAILTEYGKVTVTWWTHKIGGLHRTDFIMAARTDNLVG